MRLKRSRKPQGIVLWIIQIGFMTAAASAVFITVIAARWKSTESQLHLALMSASRAAVAQSYLSENAVTTTSSGGITLNGSLFVSTLQSASEAALNDTTGSTVACYPIPGVPATCNGANGARWWGVPVSPKLAAHGVVDIGEAQTAHDTFRLVAALDPPPVLGIQVPLGSSMSMTVILGRANQISAGS